MGQNQVIPVGQPNRPRCNGSLRRLRPRVLSLVERWMIGASLGGCVWAWGLSLGLAQDPPNLTPPASPMPQMPLVPLDDAPLGVGVDAQIWGWGGFSRDWLALVRSVDHSLAYLRTPKAEADYATYGVPGITRERVIRSVQRFRELLFTAPSPGVLQRHIQREFRFYQATGEAGDRVVHFTGYFTPTYRASLVPTAEYRYPLYRRPPNFDQWPPPHPSRVILEGVGGMGNPGSPLHGLELAWLADRLDAYLVQVQGSARLQLPNGAEMAVGYAGHTDYPYRSLGRALVEAGRFSLEELTLPKVLAYFQEHPEELDGYIAQNDRFIFFESTQGAPPQGSIGVAVTGDRSIATDKSLMPPGALALLVTELPYRAGDGTWQRRPVQQYVLDQDTGGAIRGAGRVDIFMGIGSEAGERAGLTNSEGQLYYLLLREDDRSE